MSEHRVSRRIDVAAVESPGRAVVLPLSGLDGASSPIALTGTAFLIWSHAQGDTTDQIVRAVASSVGLEPEAVDADVRGFLDDLVALRILEVSPSDP